MSSIIDLGLQQAGVGRYQVLHSVVLAAASRFTFLWHLLVIVFAGYYNDHHCTLPNGNFTIDDWIPKIPGPDGQPMYAQCSMYNDTSSNITVGCLSGMTYDPGYFDPDGGTIVMETLNIGYGICLQWNLVCDKRSFVEVAIMMMNLGVFFGTIFGASLGDLLGRRIAFFSSSVALLVSGVTSAFVPDFISYCALQFTKGLFLAGTFTQGLVLLAEVFPKELLPVVLPFSGLIASLGIAIYCGIAYFIRHWRHLQLATSLIPAVFLPYFWWCPESFLWLLSKGRNREVEQILMTISRLNKGTYKEGSLEILNRDIILLVETPPFKELDLNTNKNNNLDTLAVLDLSSNTVDLIPPYPFTIESKPAPTIKPKKQSPLMEYMKHYATRRYMIIMCYTDFVMNLTFYGLVYMMGNLTGNIYLNTALNGLFGIPSCLVTIPIVKHIGRRYPLCGFLIWQGVFMCLSAAVEYIPVPPGLNRGMLSTVFCLVAKIGEVGSAQTKMLYASELVPTSIRSTVVGIQTGCGYLGALIAPFISISLMKVQFWIPGVTYGVLAIVGGGLALLLPETRGRNMPESTQEVASWSLTLSQSEKDSIKTAKCNTIKDNKCLQVENGDMCVATDANFCVKKQLVECKSYHEFNTYM